MEKYFLDQLCRHWEYRNAGNNRRYIRELIQAIRDERDGTSLAYRNACARRARKLAIGV